MKNEVVYYYNILNYINLRNNLSIINITVELLIEYTNT